MIANLKRVVVADFALNLTNYNTLFTKLMLLRKLAVTRSHLLLPACQSDNRYIRVCVLENLPKISVVMISQWKLIGTTPKILYWFTA